VWCVQALQWRELSTCLWALATLQLLPAGYAAGSATRSGAGHTEPLSNTAASQSDANVDVLQLILDQMHARGFAAADAQSLSITTWALARLRVMPDQDWLRSLLRVRGLISSMIESLLRVAHKA
jgi:hypothetical protein